MTTISFTDMVKEVEKSVSGMYARKDWQEITNTIDSILSELRGLGFSKKIFEQFTPDELSRMAGELSVLRASLIHMKANADKNRKIAKKLKETKEASVWDAVKNDLLARGVKATKTDIEKEAARQMSRASLVYELHEAQFEVLQSYWFSIPDVLRSLQFRINVLRGDADTAKYNRLAGDEPLLPVSAIQPVSSADGSQEESDSFSVSPEQSNMPGQKAGF